MLKQLLDKVTPRFERVLNRRNLSNMVRAVVQGQEISLPFERCNDPYVRVKSAPRRGRWSRVPRRRANRPGTRARTRARQRLGVWESDELRPSAELASPGHHHRGNTRWPARRGRRGWVSRGRTGAAGAGARAWAGTGRRLGPGKRDEGWLAAEQHTDPDCFGVGWVPVGGFLRRTDGILGFEAPDNLESLGARRTKGVAVHPHLDQCRSSRSETRARCFAWCYSILSISLVGDLADFICSKVR